MRFSIRPWLVGYWLVGWLVTGWFRGGPLYTSALHLFSSTTGSCDKLQISRCGKNAIRQQGDADRALPEPCWSVRDMGHGSG